MRESFIIHTEFLDKIPDSEKGKWLLYIYNYGATEEEPQFENWLEEALWSKIKQRMDKDRETWEETKKARSEAGKIGAEKRWNKKSETPAETLPEKENKDEKENPMAKDSKAIENDGKAISDIAKMAVYVSGSVHEYVNESGSVSVYVADDAKNGEPDVPTAPHCTTSLSQNIKNTTLMHGFSMTPGQIKSFVEKTKGFNGDLPCLANFIIKRTQEKYENKPRDEIVRLYINALSKYPQDFIDEFLEYGKAEEKKIKADSRRLVYYNPPDSTCSCGAKMLEREDFDDATGIAYKAFKCPECNEMLLCENAQWLRVAGIPDRIAAMV